MTLTGPGMSPKSYEHVRAVWLDGGLSKSGVSTEHIFSLFSKRLFRWRGFHFTPRKNETVHRRRSMRSGSISGSLSRDDSCPIISQLIAGGLDAFGGRQAAREAGRRSGMVWSVSWRGAIAVENTRCVPVSGLCECCRCHTWLNFYCGCL